MWSKRISSGTVEYPAPRDVFRTLLTRMRDRGIETSWVHLEVIAEGGWLKNLLTQREPWIEVALINEQTLQLNLGIPKNKQAGLPTVPSEWTAVGKAIWNLPVAEVESLIDLIHRCFACASADDQYRACGWIEGL